MGRGFVIERGGGRFFCFFFFYFPVSRLLGLRVGKSRRRRRCRLENSSHRALAL